MDNKALADFIRTELSKLTSVINKLALMMTSLHGQREQNNTSPSPQNSPTHENNPAGGKLTAPPQLPPSPSRPQSKHPWYKTLEGWKTVLEIGAIPFAIVYAVVTCFQWRDLRQNFAAEQRSWIKVEYGIPVQIDRSASFTVLLRNVGKTPALRLHGGFMVQVVDSQSSPSFPPGGTAVMRQFFVNMLFPFVGPTDELSFSSGRTPNNPDGTVRPLDADELRRLTAGDAYVAIWGTIAYQDGFGEHWTRFCNWKTYQTGPKDFHTGGCVDWNSVGDGRIRWENPHP